MILPALISRHLKTGDDRQFYLLQAADAIRWLKKSGVILSAATRALDLGAGHGVFGSELMKQGCSTEFADEVDYRVGDARSGLFHPFNIDRQELSGLGRFDLVVCSNVLEHLAEANKFLDSVDEILTGNGLLYLSWTNWLSPWGGHEFSPFHYLGATRGHLIFDKVVRKKRHHTPFVNLFPTSIGQVFAQIRRNPRLKIIRAAPRYYTEFPGLVNVPVLREFLTWNCAMLLKRV